MVWVYLIVIVVIRLTLIGGDAPRDAYAVVKVVVALVRIGVTHGLKLTRLGVGKHAEVIVAQVAGTGIGHLQGNGEVEQTGVAEIEIACLEMHCRTAAQAVVAVLIVAFHLIGRVEQGLLEIDTEAVLEVAKAALHEDATVGVGTQGEHLAHFSLDMETTLVDIEQCDATRATDDFTMDCGDALAKQLDAVTFHLVAHNEIGVGRKEPVRFGLVSKSAAYAMVNAIQFPCVEGRHLEGIVNLEHGHRDGLFHDVFRRLRGHLQRYTQQKQ